MRYLGCYIFCNHLKQCFWLGTFEASLSVGTLVPNLKWKWGCLIGTQENSPFFLALTKPRLSQVPLCSSVGHIFFWTSPLRIPGSKAESLIITLVLLGIQALFPFDCTCGTYSNSVSGLSDIDGCPLGWSCLNPVLDYCLEILVNLYVSLLRLLLFFTKKDFFSFLLKRDIWKIVFITLRCCILGFVCNSILSYLTVLKFF